MEERAHRLIVACVIAAISAFIGASSFAAQSPTVHLRDRSATSGLQVVTWSGGPDKDHILESAGNGLMVIDHDLDGWMDLYFVNAMQFDEAGGVTPHSSRLYRNRRDLSFADVTAAAGVATDVFGSGGCVGDFDADGFPDLYVTALGPDILFRNNGDGTFSRVQVGIEASGWSTGCAFLDADGDGDEDLYVAAYIVTSVQEANAAVRHRMWRGRVPVLDGPRGFPGDRNLYFRNEGDGTFVEATEASGLTPLADSYSFAVLTFDADEDGDPDIYVANDSQANALYRNRGDGTFTEEGLISGLAYNGNGAAQGSMGLDAGDIDNDGLPEVAVTNFASDSYTLYRSLGAGLFLDVSFEAGIAVPTYTPLGWSTFFFDVDHDADQDLFFANGHLYAQVEEALELGETYRQPNQLMRNDGGVFVEITEQAGDGMAIRQSSRGAVPVDLDNDGDLDIVVSNQDATPDLLENVGAAAAPWIGFELADPGGDRAALGARVTVSTASRTQWRERRSGGTYMSEADARLHFGLGDEAVEQVTVRWRDGVSEALGPLPAGAYYRLVRGRPPQRLSHTQAR